MAASNAKWQSVASKIGAVKGNPAAQNEVADILLDFEVLGEVAKADAQKYEILNHWKNLKDADSKWNFGTLYTEKASLYISSVNQKVSDGKVTAVAAKYNTAATLLLVSQTLRLSSAQSDAFAIGLKALGVYLQIPNSGPITDSQLDLDATLANTDLLNKASKYHTDFPPPAATFHVTDYVNDIGDVLRNLGKLEQSGACYHRALKIMTDLYGENHAGVATSLNLVGNIARETGKLDEASEYYKKSLAIREGLFGENSVVVAALLNDLGILQCNQKKLDEAKATHQRALTIRTSLLGAQHPNVANSWNNLGTVLRDQGDFAEAVKCYENALQIRRNHFGEVHSHVAFTLTNLGILQQRKGDLDDAASSHKKALAIRTELFGEKHPDVVLSLNNLGSVLQQQGKQQEANEYLEKAKNIKNSL